VASGEADLAMGGDQGGSVRIPSSWCGTVGHKPTHGLVPYTGAFPIEASIDHLGPITRTVADAALMLNVIAGRDGWDPRQPADLRPEDYVAALNQDVTGLRAGLVSEGFGIPTCPRSGWTRPSGPPRTGCARRACRSRRSASRGTGTRCTSGT
jgi:amidase